MKPWESWSVWPFCLGVFPPQSRAETHRFFKGNLTPSVCTGCAPDVLISLYFLSEQCLPLNFIWFNNYLTERAVQHSTKLCRFLEPRINLKTNDGWREKLLFMGRPESCMFCDDENIFLSVDSGLLNLQLKHASDSTFISLIHLNFAHMSNGLSLSTQVLCLHALIKSCPITFVLYCMRRYLCFVITEACNTPTQTPSYNRLIHSTTKTRGGG